jgi:hypothetical protein
MCVGLVSWCGHVSWVVMCLGSVMVLGLYMFLGLVMFLGSSCFGLVMFLGLIIADQEPRNMTGPRNMTQDNGRTISMAQPRHVPEAKTLTKPKDITPNQETQNSNQTVTYYNTKNMIAVNLTKPRNVSNSVAQISPIYVRDIVRADGAKEECASEGDEEACAEAWADDGEATFYEPTSWSAGLACSPTARWPCYATMGEPLGRCLGSPPW